MKKTSLILPLFGAVAFVALSGFGFGTFGKPSPERVKRFIDYRVDDALDQLKATPQQSQAIHAQVDLLYPQALTLMHAHEQTKAQVTDLLAQDKVDSAQLHNLVDARIDDFRAFAHKVVDAVIAVHDTFTPAQRAQLATQAREHQKEAAASGW